MFEEDHGRIIVTGALAELDETLFDVLAASTGGSVEVDDNEGVGLLGIVKQGGEFRIGSELPDAVHRAKIVIFVVSGLLLLRFSELGGIKSCDWAQARDGVRSARSEM